MLSIGRDSIAYETGSCFCGHAHGGDRNSQPVCGSIPYMDYQQPWRSSCQLELGRAAPNGIGATALINVAPGKSGDFFTNLPMTLGTLWYTNSGNRILSGVEYLNFQTSSGNALFHTTSSSGSLWLHVPTVLLSSSTPFRIENTFGV